MNGRAHAQRASDVAVKIDRILAAERTARAAVDAEAQRAEERLERARALARERMERTQQRVARLHAAVDARIAEVERQAKAGIADRVGDSSLPGERLEAVIAALAVRLTTLESGMRADAP